MPLTQENAAPDWRRCLFTEYITHAPHHFCPRYAVSDERYKVIFNVLGGERENPLTPANYCNAWWESQMPKYLQTPIREVYDRVEHVPQIELYDLQNDPYEWSNLAEHSESAEGRARPLQAVADWRESTRDPLLNPVEFKKEESKVNGSS